MRLLSALPDMLRGRTAEPGRLAQIVPPRHVEGAMERTATMLSALSDDEPVSYELELTADGPRWYVRAAGERSLARAVARLRAAFPGVECEFADTQRPDLDPLRPRAREQAAAVVVGGPRDAALPIASGWRDGLWREDLDPLEGVLAAAVPAAGERVVCALTLQAAAPRAAERVRHRAPPVERPAQHSRLRRESDDPGPFRLGLLGVGAFVGVRAWQWWQAGAYLHLALGLLGCVVLFVIAVTVRRRLLGAPLLAPDVVARKLEAPLLRGRLTVTALGPRAAGGDALHALAERVAAAYGAYDEAGGGRLDAGSRAHGGELLLNAREAAALWHPPVRMDQQVGARRSTARRLLPPPGHARRGVLVGVSDADPSMSVYQPEPLLGRNQLIVAKTRRGKSTLLLHQFAGIAQRIAEGRRGAVVVVDPHADLAEAVLGQVPPELHSRTIYLDFANLERPVGLNFLDVALFPDRDRTTEATITMMRRMWERNWGPRMEGAIRTALATLHTANQGLPRDRQHTLLDVAALLTDDRFRDSVAAEVDDRALDLWWEANYDRAGRVLKQQTANPVTSKVGRFLISEPTRNVFGQSASTFDPGALLRDGGVLVVNTAVGALGEDTAGLLGATMLNLLSLLIGQQVLLPAEERTPVTVLIDESSTLAGVDYQTMLSELPKYGGAFVMVTQSLAKLDAIDPTLVQTILSNIDGLTAFQCSAEDAARLAPQLGEDVSVEDLIALDDFTACVRWWDGRTLPAPFTFRVNPPPPHNQTRQRDLAARSALEFGRDRAEVAAAILRVLDDLMSRRERPPAAASELRTPADPGTELAALQPPWSVP